MQEVPNAAKRAARAQVADARAGRERALLHAEQLAVRREAAQAWLARYFAERRLDLFRSLEDENRLLQDTLAARVAGGKAMPGEMTMARQEALQLADRRDELARDRAKALASLRRWLGDDAQQPLAGAPPAGFAVTDELHGQLDRHADLQVFGPMVEMARAEAAEIEAAKHGDWGWQVGYSKRGSAYGDMVSFQFNLELPLWGQQRQDPQIAAKRKEAERIASEREELLRRHREEIDTQLAEHEEQTRKLARLRQYAIPLANERVALALAAYESARGDLAAVLAARRERAELGLRAIELEAQQQSLRARLNYYVAEQR
jgi:outer membrane protein, heavy metal efflux system